ncbi:MAG: carbohydrate-binding domain-containing protein [Prevotella sp.]|nr:carbohydrate-binding domain-containing protein [Prevotella sp.]
MKSQIFFVLCVTFLLTACGADSLDDFLGGSVSKDDNNKTDTVPGNSELAGLAGNLLDFDIFWDDLLGNGFIDAAEEVPTDEEDEEYDDFVENASFKSQINIAYDGTSAIVTGSVSNVDVSVDGADVTVNSTAKSVEYVLSGSTTNGSFKIYSDNKIKLTLNGLSLTSAKGAAINIQSGKGTYLESVSGTENTLSDAAVYSNNIDGEDQKACLFSEGQLLFSGSGTLTVSGKNRHGICSDDYVYIHAGTKIEIVSSASDAIHANQKIIIAGGMLEMSPSSDGIECEDGNIDIRGGLVKANITGEASKALKAGTDVNIMGGQVLLLTSGDAKYDTESADVSSCSCIKSNGSVAISDAVVYMKSTGSAGKGINSAGTVKISNSDVRVITTGEEYVYGSLNTQAKGIKADGALTIDSGTVWVRTTGGNGSEGISSKTALTINDGTVCVNSYGDCISATNSITISGGNIYCYSDENDGMDSNGTVTITGGMIVTSGSSINESGIDSQSTFKITGGTLIGIGGDTSTPISSSTQPSVIYNGSGSSGYLFTIAATDGTDVMSYVIPRDYSKMVVLFSSPLLDSGTSYTIYNGGSVEGGTSFYGLTTGGIYTAGTSTATFTPSSMVTTVASSSSAK